MTTIKRSLKSGKQIKLMFKDLTLIILGAGLSSAFYFWQTYKDKKEIKKQERLNEIKTK